jgi:hypothetical protein
VHTAPATEEVFDMSKTENLEPTNCKLKCSTVFAAHCWLSDFCDSVIACHGCSCPAVSSYRTPDTKSEAKKSTPPHGEGAITSKLSRDYLIIPNLRTDFFALVYKSESNANGKCTTTTTTINNAHIGMVSSTRAV